MLNCQKKRREAGEGRKGRRKEGRVLLTDLVRIPDAEYLFSQVDWLT